MEIWQSSPSQMWISDIFRLQSLWHTAVSDCQVQSCCYFTTFCLETFGPSSKDLSLHDCAEHVSHRRLRAAASRHTLMLVWCHEKIQIKPGRQFKSKRLLSMVLQWKWKKTWLILTPNVIKKITVMEKSLSQSQIDWNCHLGAGSANKLCVNEHLRASRSSPPALHKQTSRLLQTLTSPDWEVHSTCLCWPTRCCRRYQSSGAETAEKERKKWNPHQVWTTANQLPGVYDREKQRHTY